MAFFNCVSVVGGWQTAVIATGRKFGPVFNASPDLWQWQGGNLPRLTIEESQALRARDAALHAWMNAKKTNFYHPDELPDELHPTLTNEQRAELELIDWLTDPPARYSAYTKSDRFGITGAEITNFTGRKLARIDWRGSVYFSNFGDRRCNFGCTGTNGITYTGTAYIDAGDYVRIRAIKG